MSRQIKDIKDKNTGQLVYPKTHIKAVVVNEGTTLEQLLGSNVDDRLNKLESVIVTDGEGNLYLTDDGTYKDLNEYQKIVDADAKYSTITTVNGINTRLEEVEATYINKSTAATKEELATKQDIIEDLETIRSGAALGATSVQPDDIHNMETKANSSYLYQLKGDYATKTELNNSLDSAKTYTDDAIANLVGSSSDNINAVNQLSTTLQNNSDIVSLLNNSVSNKADKSLIFNNIQTQTWEVIEDITFPYNYSCNVTLENVTANDYAEVTFSMINAISGNYAPVCETYDGGVTIYSKIADIITIPTIIIYKNN